MSDDNTQVIPENNTTTQNQEDAPEWARKAISEANAEAAKYRTKAKTAAEEATNAVTTQFNEQIKVLSDEKSAIADERDTATANYAKLVAALGAGVPGDTAVEFAGLLQGSNAEEYTSHAEKLKGMFGGSKPKAVDPSHGLSGTTNQTPDEMFAAIFQSNLSRK